MQDALRTYLELATGLTEVSRKRVRKIVKDAVGRGNATADQVRVLTSDLLAANAANREAIVKLVRFEVDRALGALGLATAEEVNSLTARIRELEGELRAAERRAGVSALEGARVARRTAGKRVAAAAKAPAKRAAPAKKAAAAKKAAPARAVPERAPAKKAPAEKAPAEKAPAKKAQAKRAPAKKAPAKRAPAKKAQP